LLEKERKEKEKEEKRARKKRKEKKQKRKRKKRKRKVLPTSNFLFHEIDKMLKLCNKAKTTTQTNPEGNSTNESVHAANGINPLK